MFDSLFVLDFCHWLIYLVIYLLQLYVQKVLKVYIAKRVLPEKNRTLIYGNLQNKIKQQINKDTLNIERLRNYKI